jgi:hypothetical protein
MSPLMETFANLSKRGWIAGILPSGGWVAIQTSAAAGNELWGAGTGTDLNGNVYAVFRNVLNASAALITTFNGKTGALISQKRWNSGAVAPGGGIGDGTSFYVGAGNNVVKYDTSLNEVWANNASVQASGYNQINNTRGSYFAMSSYNLNNTGSLWSLYNTNGTLVWTRRNSGSATGTGWSAATTVNGIVYGTGSNASTFLVINAAGNFSTGFQLATEVFNNNINFNTMVTGDDMILSTPVSALNAQYVMRINSSGGIVWQRKITGASSTPSTNAIVGADASGNVYAVWGGGQQFVNLVKYNSSGVLQWQRKLQGSLGTVAFYVQDYGSLFVDPSGKYLTFNMKGSTTNWPGVVVKLPTDGSGLGTTPTFNGMTFTYSATSNTDAAGIVTMNNPGGSIGAWTNTVSAGSPGYTATTFTFASGTLP